MLRRPPAEGVSLGHPPHPDTRGGIERGSLGLTGVVGTVGVEPTWLLTAGQKVLNAPVRKYLSDTRHFFLTGLTNGYILL